MPKVSLTNQNEKRCSSCGETKSVEEFGKVKSRKDGIGSWCISCRKERSKRYYHSDTERNKAYYTKRYQENRERLIKSTKEYVQRNKPKVNKYFRERFAKLREKFLSMYGEVCQCCGESEKAFLALDHVNGQAGKKNKENGAFAYLKATKEHGSGKYRILCANCNTATRLGKICPHQLKATS